jgi:23S rRNA (guanosine2251-2'-O)-methyltransferase
MPLGAAETAAHKVLPSSCQSGCVGSGFGHAPDHPGRVTRPGPLNMRSVRPPRQTRTSSVHGRAAVGSRRPLHRDAHWLYGRHTVTAALANPERRWRRLVVLAGQEAEARSLLAAAAAKQSSQADPSLEVLRREAFTALLPAGAVHQGFALEVEPLLKVSLDDFLREAKTVRARCVVLALDQVSDPQNIGAVLRSAAAFGGRAVVIATHGAPAITGALAKAASGAIDRVPLVRVVNLARSLAQLKAAGFWICGLDETADQRLAALDLGPRVVLVLGSEGSGLRRLVREQCDHLARLPTSALQPTLNVSNAAAVALYEFARGVESG